MLSEFLKISEDISPFAGPLIPLFWNSGEPGMSSVTTSTRLQRSMNISDANAKSSATTSTSLQLNDTFDWSHSLFSELSFTNPQEILLLSCGGPRE